MATGGGRSCAATGGKCADVVFEMVGGIMFPERRPDWLHK